MGGSKKHLEVWGGHRAWCIVIIVSKKVNIIRDEIPEVELFTMQRVRDIFRC